MLLDGRLPLLDGRIVEKNEVSMLGGGTWSRTRPRREAREGLARDRSRLQVGEEAGLGAKAGEEQKLLEPILHRLARDLKEVG